MLKAQITLTLEIDFTRLTKVLSKLTKLMAALRKLTRSLLKSIEC